MSKAFWQAKIWGLLHDPALKTLRPSKSLGDEGPWECLATTMADWVSPKAEQKPKESAWNSTWLSYVGMCDLIASASDRASIGRVPYRYGTVTHTEKGLQIRHLLSGQPFQLTSWLENFEQEGRYPAIRKAIRKKELEELPEEVWHEWDDPRKVFWWFWRCYPEVIAKEIPETQLLPADTRIPDVSLWSHCSMTSALAGALAGYFSRPEEYPQKGKPFERSRPFLVTFTFTPIQEVIQASRKMRDFWAGSWALHYLSAKVCWALAKKYGPDTFIYPCLYDQPLIDHWLRQEYPDFDAWLPNANQPGPQQTRLLTAGFPNVLVMVLPNNGQGLEDGGPIASAMQHAEQILQGSWQDLGKRVLDKLKGREQVWRDIYLKLWDNWLASQWQLYWTASPLGDYKSALNQSPSKTEEFYQWSASQNKLACPDEPLFQEGVAEDLFLREVMNLVTYKQPNCNVGSWWGSLVNQLRINLQGLKNGRTWQLPTAIGPRSTISGIGPVLRKPAEDLQHSEWAKESETRQFWQHHAGMFDGIEELNATEVVKRGLHQVLGDVLNLDQRSGKIPVLYPDLSSGVAGWLKQLEKQREDDGNQSANQKTECYEAACRDIAERFPWVVENGDSPGCLPWGIPWIAKYHANWLNPRLLNAGWLIDDYSSADSEARQQTLRHLKTAIAEHFAEGNNPTDWYVVASGDGDDMGQWLQGIHLKNYQDYIANDLNQKLDKMPDGLADAFQGFLEVPKRIGPSTHAALSRALLDFSNQLVPYLTEQRYAGRLIYCGGDDILAYSNLWEWDSWLWDILQCFKGKADPENEFVNDGDYWRWDGDHPPEPLPKRPLFTMGSHKASISFGLVIAHQSVPLAIALENMEEAKDEAKAYEAADGSRKDAVQVRVLYSNGNKLKTTAKSDLLEQWKELLQFQATHPEVGFDPALFEQAAELIRQHPIPSEDAISYWVNAFCSRRDIFQDTEAGAEAEADFKVALSRFVESLWKTTPSKDFAALVGNWLKLVAFTLRKRDIQPKQLNKQGGNT